MRSPGGRQPVAKLEKGRSQLDLYIAEQQRGPEMILITVAPVGYLGSWSASIDGRVICASVRLPLVAAAKALLAEGHAPQTEIAMKARGARPS